MVVAFIIIETNYSLVSLFCDVVLFFPIYISGIKFLICCAIGLVSGIPTKATLFSLYSVLQIVLVMVLC